MITHELELIITGIIISALVLIPGIHAEIFDSNGSKISMNNTSIDQLIEKVRSYPEPITASMFYSSHCGSCHDTVSYLTQLSQNQSELGPVMYDLVNNTTNGKIFDQTKSAYHMRRASYPVVFIGPFVLQGADTIALYYELLAREAFHNQQNPILEMLTRIITDHFT